MQQNENNPGIVERQLDETPVEGMSASDREIMEREGMQGGGPVEREGMQDGSVEREGMQGGSVERNAMQDGGMDRDSLTGRESEQLGAENMNANDTEMRTSALEGGQGYDRPADMTVTRDTMEGSSRTDQGTDRGNDMTRSPDQPRGTTTARDW